MWLFKVKNLQAGSIEVYRGSLSATLPRIEGYKVGSHPIIVDLLKAFICEKPRQYKLAPKWSVDHVLLFLEKWGLNSNLSLKMITLKLSMLLALSSASRCAELAFLDEKNMIYKPGGIEFTLTRHKKNRKSSILPGKMFFPELDNKPILCPVKCLQDYLVRTSKLKTDNSIIIRSFIKPHKAVLPRTISKWLTSLIFQAGGFNPKDMAGRNMGHSTRSVSSSKAMNAGMTTLEVLEAAEWKSENVFSKFYYNKSNFGRTVLTMAD